MKKKIVLLTGAGISAESGISTFRDSNGLWENHKIEDVATPRGWEKDKVLVLEFYNKRRKQLFEVEPNLGHMALVELEQKYDVTVITQNVDDLHERAGSKNVLHLHGELRKARSIGNPNLVYEWTKDLNIGDKCKDGFQLRPHIVWFEEEVPMIETAIDIVAKADILIVIGTSMNVYPAASLVNYLSTNAIIYFVDPNPNFNKSNTKNKLEIFAGKATIALPIIVKKLING
jgi:NAD-dependent deacetylase